MQYKALQRITKDYDSIFSKERTTDEIEIKTYGTVIVIEEHQMGMPLFQPHISITTGGITYCMDWDVFLNKIKS